MRGGLGVLGVPRRADRPDLRERVGSCDFGKYGGRRLPAVQGSNVGEMLPKSTVCVAGGLEILSIGNTSNCPEMPTRNVMVSESTTDEQRK